MTNGYIISATHPHFHYLCWLSDGLLWNGLDRQGVTVWPTRAAARRAIARTLAHKKRHGFEDATTYTVRRLVSQ